MQMRWAPGSNLGTYLPMVARIIWCTYKPTCLYLGLTTDSGNFKYDTNHEKILANAMKLVQLRSRKKLIIDKAIRRRSLRSVKMMQRLFDRLQQKWGLVYSRYNNKDIEELQLQDDEADDGQIVIQDIEEAVVTSIFREQNGYFHGSMRSKEYNVEQIASSFVWRTSPCGWI